MLAFVLAVLAAAVNAVASVLQRRANAENSASQARRRVRSAFRVVRSPRWLIGAACLPVSFLLQAVALGYGRLSTVQAVLALELPMTVAFTCVAVRVRPDRSAVLGIVGMTGGLAAVLTLLAPSGGSSVPPAPGDWLLPAAAVCGLIAVLLALSWATPSRERERERGRERGREDAGDRRVAVRAALLGAASGTAFGLTAALTKALTQRLAQGPATAFGSWELYTMLVCGAGAFLLLQTALRSGPLWWIQPGLTLVDPLVALALGVAVFHEHLRPGPPRIGAAAAAAVVVVAAVLLARSPVLRTESDVPDRQG